MSLRTCTNFLFTPANRPDRFLKARQTGADGIIIDLEDAVALQDKDSARASVIDFLQHARKPDDSLVVAVRINSIQTAAGLADVLALAQSAVAPDALFFPKVEYAQEVILYEKHFSGPAWADVAYAGLIETAVGLQNAHDIAAASPRMAALVFGGVDLAADLGAAFEFEALLHARSRVVQAAKMHGCIAIDVPFLDIKDDASQRQEAERVKALGFDGKLAIHPGQIATLIDVFTPSSQACEQALAVVQAYDQAQGNAVQLNGKMIDVPVYKAARRLLDIAQKKNSN